MKLLAEFEIKGAPKTVNSLVRMHWAAKYNEAKRWKQCVGICCRQLKINGMRLKKATLEFTRFSSREPDFDNLAGSFKHILDGLVEAEVIVDDKPSVIGSPIFAWEKCKRSEVRIRVRILCE